MKNIIWLSLALLGCITSTAFANAPKEEKLDQIVAIVNDDVITRTEYNHALNTIKTQLTQQNVPMPPPDVLQKQVLTQLINNKLQVEVGKQAGIQIPDQEVDKTIQGIAK